VEFSMPGGMIAVRCPVELAPIMRRAGGMWEPGTRRWLIERRRIGPVLPALAARVAPAFPPGSAERGRRVAAGGPSSPMKRPCGGRWNAAALLTPVAFGGPLFEFERAV
jgi:hypothetical protein